MHVVPVYRGIAYVLTSLGLSALSLASTTEYLRPQCDLGHMTYTKPNLYWVPTHYMLDFAFVNLRD